MTARVSFFARSETEVATTSTVTWADCVTLSFYAEANTDYYIFVNWQQNTNTTASASKFRLTVDDSLVGEVEQRDGEAGDEEITGFFLHRHQQGGSAGTVNLALEVQSEAGATITFRAGSILCLKKASTDVYAEDLTDNTYTTTIWANVAAVAEGVGTGDQILVIGQMNHGNSTTTGANRIRLYDGSTGYYGMTAGLDMTATSNVLSHALFYTQSAPAGSTTWSIQASEGGTTTMTSYGARILVLDIAGVTGATGIGLHTADLDTDSSSFSDTTGTSYVVLASRTSQTFSSSYTYLILGHGDWTQSSSTSDGRNRFRIDGTVRPDTSNSHTSKVDVNAVSDQVNVPFMDYEVGDGGSTHSYDLYYASSAGDIQEYDYSLIALAIDVEANPPAPVVETYLVDNSLPTVAEYNSGTGRLISSRMPISWWFSPKESGYLTYIDFLLYSDGTPAAKNVDVVLFKANAANPLVSPSESNSWTIISTGQIVPASVTATNSTNIAWVRVPMQGVTLDSGGIKDNGRDEHRAFAFTYGLSLRRTAANSDNGTGGTTDLIRYVVANSKEFGFGMYQPGSGGTGQVRFFDNKHYSEMPIRLVGSVQPSSSYLDYSIGCWSYSVPGSVTTNNPLNPAFFRQRAVRFTAQGSYVTRAAAAMIWRGNNKIRLDGKIYTDTGSLPGTVVACGHAQIETQTGGNFWIGNPADHQVDVMFVFSAAITSGTNYWFSVEAQSYQFNTNSFDVNWLRGVTANSLGHAALDANTTVWAAGYDETFKFEVWYQDSATANFFPPAPAATSGAIIRDFPVSQNRAFPVILRQFPTD